MKLSEAIRLGAMLRKQGHDYMRANGRTCALGAAAEAGGFKLKRWQSSPDQAMRERWPLLSSWKSQPCPDCAYGLVGVISLVTHLNDSHDWTRERIADLIESIESSQSVDAVREPSDRAVSPARV